MLGAQTNFLVLIAVLATLGALSWLFRAQIKRLKDYFVAWAERDKREEERARAEAQQRKAAEAELREKLVEAQADGEDEALVQKIKRER